jgi:hypothetical protein
VDGLEEMTTDVTGVVYETNHQDETVELLRERAQTVPVDVGEFFSEFRAWRKYSITETESVVFANESFRRVTGETTVRDVSEEAEFLEFAVTGDTHLGYTRRSGDTNGQNEGEAFTAFARLVDFAITEELDALLHVGDVFHGQNVEPGEFGRLEEELRRLTQNDVGFGYVIGNHDPEGRLRELRELAGVVHLGEGEVRDYGPLNIVGYDHDSLSNLTTIPEETTASADIILAHPENADNLSRFCRNCTETCTAFVGHNHEYARHGGRTATTKAIRPGTVAGVRTLTRDQSCDSLLMDVERQPLR